MLEMEGEKENVPGDSSSGCFTRALFFDNARRDFRPDVAFNLNVLSATPEQAGRETLRLMCDRSLSYMLNSARSAQHSS